MCVKNVEVEGVQVECEECGGGGCAGVCEECGGGGCACVCVKNVEVEGVEVEVEVCGMRWTDLGGGGHLLELLDESAEAGTFLWLH